MQRPSIRKDVCLSLSITAVLYVACGMQPGPANIANSNTNSNANASANSNANPANSNSASSMTVDSREPDAYDATVTIKVEGIGSGQSTAMPNLNAKVSKSGNDRRMEFTMPAGGHVVFLDKGGTNYLILPDLKQYALLEKESLGFDVRRMLMPEQIVAQVKGVQGMQLIGEEKYNGRDAVKYRYAATANTQSQAGQVNTESFLLVDKATGLPLHTETVSQSQNGNVQGYNGFRVITEITDINTQPATEQFAEPTNLQKIESSAVRAQVDIIFNSMATFLAQLLKQGQQQATPSPAG